MRGDVSLEGLLSMCKEQVDMCNALAELESIDQLERKTGAQLVSNKWRRKRLERIYGAPENEET